jgi:hypothetical protein
VSSREHDAAVAAHETSLAALEEAVRRRAGALDEMATLAERDAGLTNVIVEMTATRKSAGQAVGGLRAELRELAVSDYVRGANLDELTRAIDIEAVTEVGAAQQLSGVLLEQRRNAQAAVTANLVEANAAIVAARDERGTIRERSAELEASRAAADAAIARLTVEVEQHAAERAATRATATVVGGDFSLVALDAYVRGARGEASCGIPWWAIAGISRVEGRHGTFGGARPLASGDLSRPIIGITLDGTRSRAVPDTDGGELDGDSTWDHAVGPMQFIPGTWRRWARDGDGDGDRDPQNLYDAAASAAAYLCSGGPMTTDAELRGGYIRYNRSEAYVENVLGHAHRYRAMGLPL